MMLGAATIGAMQMCRNPNCSFPRMGAPDGAAEFRKPSEVRKTSSITPEQLQAASTAKKPEYFRPIEPLMEELTDKKPLSHDHIQLMNTDLLKVFCGEFTVGCYSPKEKLIRIAASTSPLTVQTKRSCASAMGTSTYPYEFKFPAPTPLLHYVHEQGHYLIAPDGDPFETSLRNHMAVDAMVYFFAEHMARNYDKNTGLRMFSGLLGSLVIYEDDPQSQSVPNFVLTHPNFALMGSELSEIYDVSIIALLGSAFDSFGEVWRFTSTTPPSVVAEAVKANSSAFPYGIRKVQHVFFDLAGKRQVADENFVYSSIDRFEFGAVKSLGPSPGGGLHFDSEKYSASFYTSQKMTFVDITENKKRSDPDGSELQEFQFKIKIAEPDVLKDGEVPSVIYSNPYLTNPVDMKINLVEGEALITEHFSISEPFFYCYDDKVSQKIDSRKYQQEMKKMLGRLTEEIKKSPKARFSYSYAAKTTDALLDYLAR